MKRRILEAAVVFVAVEVGLSWVLSLFLITPAQIPLYNPTPEYDLIFGIATLVAVILALVDFFRKRDSERLKLPK